jgi:hypothetical protein
VQAAGLVRAKVDESSLKFKSEEDHHLLMIKQNKKINLSKFPS